MTGLLDKLNLRPQERRLVVFVGIIVFGVLNLLLVWPHFGDLGRAQQKRRDAEMKLRRYQDELKRRPEYERELRRLEELGGLVPSEEQALQLQREVEVQARASGVQVQRWDATPRTTSARTNSFFDEQSLTITVNTGEKELVDFLWHLGARESLTRVRRMNLGRDPSQFRLAGSITLVKSFQRKAPARPAASPARPALATAAPASKSTNVAVGRAVTSGPPASVSTAAPPAAKAAAKAEVKPGPVSPQPKPAVATNVPAGLTNLPKRPIPPAPQPKKPSP